MSILNQKTIKKPISFNGVGLHTGAKVNLKIIPAEPNAGILFKRIDIDKNNMIIPNVFNVTNTTLCTTISNEFGIKVSTIEHLMWDLYGIGIDNALIVADLLTKKNIELSVRNISNIKLIDPYYLSTYDILKYKQIMFTESSTKELEKRLLDNE